MNARILGSPARRFKPLRHLAVLALMWLSMTAANAALVCAASVASVPVLDPNATASEVGELTLTCSGGVVTNPLPLVDFQSFFNVPLRQDAAPLLTDGTTDYVGSFSGANSIVFLGIPIDPVASLFTFEQVFVNPGLLATGLQIIEFLSVTGGIAVPVDNPQQLVAVIGTSNTVTEPPTALLLAACGGLLLLRLRKHGPLGAQRLPGQLRIAR